jgi:hypothetical protein
MVYQNHEEEKNSSEFFEADVMGRRTLMDQRGLSKPLREKGRRNRPSTFFSCLISDEIRQEGVFQNSLCFIPAG